MTNLKDKSFDTFEKSKTFIKVDFPTFVNMTHLQINCLYDTVNHVNRKIDYLYNNLGKELIDISKVREINNEMEQLQKNCNIKFEVLKTSLNKSN